MGGGSTAPGIWQMWRSTSIPLTREAKGFAPLPPDLAATRRKSPESWQPMRRGFKEPLQVQIHSSKLPPIFLFFIFVFLHFQFIQSEKYMKYLFFFFCTIYWYQKLCFVRSVTCYYKSMIFQFPSHSGEELFPSSVVLMFEGLFMKFWRHFVLV